MGVSSKSRSKSSNKSRSKSSNKSRSKSNSRFPKVTDTVKMYKYIRECSVDKKIISLQMSKR